MIKYKRILLSISILPLLAGCYPESDLHGIDPRDYYAAHPIENKVETRHAVYAVQFDDVSTTITANAKETLRDLNFRDLDNVSANAVESISLQFDSGMAHKDQRVQHIKKLFKEYKVPVKLVPSEDVERNKLIIDVTYAAVVTPDCPDWKLSPVTTYSNVPMANFACASRTNFGLMVDNPRDLVSGQSTSSHYTERSGKVVSDYRTGVSTNGTDLVSSATTN